MGSSKTPKSRVKVMGNWENHWANVERSQWPGKTGMFTMQSTANTKCFVTWQKWVHTQLSNIRIFFAWFYKVIWISAVRGMTSCKGMLIMHL